MITHQPFRLSPPVILAALLVNLPLGDRTEAAAPPAPRPAQESRHWVNQALLTMRVQSSLAGRLDTDALRIRVSVQGRTVILTGEVEKQSSIALAESTARSVEGVEDVTNRLTLYGER